MKSIHKVRSKLTQDSIEDKCYDKSLKNRRHNAQVSNFENNVNVCTKVWLGLEWREEEEWLGPKHAKMREEK